MALQLTVMLLVILNYFIQYGISLHTIDIYVLFRQVDELVLETLMVIRYGLIFTSNYDSHCVCFLKFLYCIKTVTVALPSLRTT